MEQENNRIVAIIFSLIGGLIGTIPWILVYVYGNMIVALLAIIIAMAAWKGYNLAKGKIDKYVPTIIVIISVISVTIATFIIIPALLLVKGGNSVTIEAIKELYEYRSFASAITKDYLISLLFTFLGISGVITNMKNQIRTGKKVNLINYTTITDEEKQTMYNAFNKLGALEKSFAKTQKEIIDNIEDDNKEILFMKFLSNGVIKNYKGKYYYSEEVAKNPGKAQFKKTMKIFLYTFLILIVFSVIVAILASKDNSSNDDEINEFQNEKVTYNRVTQDNKISYDLPSNWLEIEKYRKEGTYYYTPSIDKTGYSGIISVSYWTTEYTTSDYEEFKAAIKETYEEDQDESVIDSKMNELTTETGYKVIEVVTSYKDDTYPSTEYMYYILDDGAYALVYLTDYYSKYVKDPKTVAYGMVNKFEFIKGEENYG